MSESNRNVQLAKNTIVLTVGKICTQFVSFFLLPLYTALLDPSDYGTVDLISTYATLLLPIVGLELSSGLFRFILDVRKDSKKTDCLISTAMTVTHFQLAGFLLLFAVIQIFVHSQYKMILAIEIALDLYSAILMQISRGLGRNDIYSVASFLSASTMVAMNVIFIAVMRMGIYGMFLGLILSKIITNLYLFVSLKIWRHYHISLFDKEELKAILRYSMPLVPNQLSWWVVGASDRLVVSHFLGVACNGLYSVANKFSSIYITFYNIFNMAWTESAALHFNDKDGEEYLNNTVNTLFPLFSSICIGITACVSLMFPVLINEQYAAAYPQIPILMMAVMCQSIIGMVSVVYTAKKMSAAIAKTSFWVALVNLSTDLLMIHFIGLYAASLSTLIAYGAMMLYRLHDVQKYAKIKIPTGMLAVTILLAVGVCVAYYSNSIFLQVVALLLAVLYAIVSNRKFLKDIVCMGLSYIRK